MKSSHLKAATVAALLMGLLACSTDEPVSTSGMLGAQESLSGIEISVISTKSWLVTGGDALVEVVAPDSSTPNPYSVRLNDTDVTDRFVQVSGTRRQALLSGLPLGDSTIEVKGLANGSSQTLTVTNYPSAGPIISGPHETPFVCQTAEFELVTGEMLGETFDADCAVDSRIDYVYWSSADSEFKPYSVPAGETAIEDLAYLDEASAVPFIVRVETGTVNRAVYEIAMLHDPADRAPTPWNPSAAWNNKLIFTHGGGCRSGWYQQGSATGGVLNRGLLEQGYALASSTLNVFGQNCNDLLASETHIMLKELFIERYGVPVYTLATGVSGGSYQSHQTADNYPGIFDGIIVGLSFPDVTSATIFTLADSRLLHHYFTEIDPEGFSREQELAVSGFAEHASIANLSRGAARLDPIFTEDGEAEEQGSEFSIIELEQQRYSPDNPSGLRATVYDHTVNVYGEVAGINSSVAARPLDNIGVQYGLKALNEGVITPQQFIDLNREIGGFDRDFEHVNLRTRADASAVKNAVESGRILYGGAGLRATPIIDYRSYLDNREGGDIHMIVHQFSTRARLINANGHADNQIMQVGGRWGFDQGSPDLGALFAEMDRWVMAIKADTTGVSSELKTINNKPAELLDACWNNDASTRQKITQQLSANGSGDCAELYPVFSTPRHVAGAPLANDVVSCSLQAIDFDSYTVEFSPEQMLELVDVFPEGVCNWRSGDRHRVSHQGTWLSFGPSPVNRLD